LDRCLTAARSDDHADLPLAVFDWQLGVDAKFRAALHVKETLHARGPVALRLGASMVNVDDHTVTTRTVRPRFFELLEFPALI
jgi:hypothetical protein